MLMSVDGKISTGASDALDVDKDFPKIQGLKEGVGQYYEIEQTTDLWSFNSGRVQEKMGANEKPFPQKTPVSFVLLDNTHLTEHGVRYFCARSKEFVLFTSNKNHPAYGVKEDNLHIFYQEKLDLKEGLEWLYKKFGCERITIQSGGTLNGLFLREKLFDFVDLVVAPVLVGGKDTATLIDGKSLLSEDELSSLGVMKLLECKVLKDSYLRLRYEVVKENPGKKVKDYIAYCGLDCETCEARIATKNNDDTLRESVAKKWSEFNKVEITPQMINCEGCRTGGIKTAYCEYLCSIRQCAKVKKIDTCGNCERMNSCDKLKMITMHNPKAIDNLR